MIKNVTLRLFTAILLLNLAMLNAQKKNAGKRPNILVIVSDDQGNSDAGYQRTPSTVNTPAIDALAKDGVIFTNGYASGYVCSPTRAGILTGRYQQRFGFYEASDSRQGLPLNEITVANVLKNNGYVTGVFGKWHLGLKEAYHPLNRGFDNFYGFLGHGAHDYFDLGMVTDQKKEHEAIYRDMEQVADTGYLTDNLAKESIHFIKKNANKKDPFFLYLPFNAVHTPMQAPKKDIAQFKTGDPKRDIYLAMLHRMDIAIGNVIQTLKDEEIYENTLIFFFSDNGGARANSSNNLPLRGYKQMVYEGGLRVPFIISWPNKLKHSFVDEPVISFDVMPTICATLGINLPKNVIYDGKNIMSAIDGKLKKPLHDRLFFDGNQGSWAVREGDWKLLTTKRGSLELYDMKNDYLEKNNLVEKHPEKVADLTAKYQVWRREMAEPMGANKQKRKKNKKKNKN